MLDFNRSTKHKKSDTSETPECNAGDQAHDIPGFTTGRRYNGASFSPARLHV